MDNNQDDTNRDDAKNHVTVTVRNPHRNPLHLNTGHPVDTHFDVPPKGEATAVVHRDQLPRLQRLGLEVRETSPRDSRRRDGQLEGHGDYSQVNQNVAGGVQASDKNTIDPTQRMAVAAASGDYADLQGVAHKDDPTAAQKRLQEEANVDNPGTGEAGAGTGEGDEDSLEKLLHDVEQETLTFAQLRSRAKTLLGNDFPSGYSPKKDEIVELLHNAQRKKARS